MKKNHKKFFVKITMLLFVLSLSLGMVACGGNADMAGRTKVTFAYFADPGEAKVISDSINWYNENEGKNDNIYIDKQPKSGQSYVDFMEKISSGEKGPDLFLVDDRHLKRWATDNFGLLENLQPYVERDNIDFSGMWPGLIMRDRYDPAQNTNNFDDPLYAIPRDISPTVLFYNESMFEKHGIKVISVDEEDIDAFNNGAKDLRGKTKADYGISSDFEVPAKGFIRDNPRKHGQNFIVPQYDAQGKIAEDIIFNNRIAMSWDEIEDLAMIFTRKYNPHLTSEDTKWGYYTEWWFNYGWGVGGDCAVDTTGEGDWVFTLGDKTKKKLLYNEDGSEVIDETGKAVFVPESEWATYELEEGQYLGKELPTQYEAFERFVNLGKPIEAGGLEIAMRQKADIGTSTPTTFFTNQSVAMLVQPITSIDTFRNGINDKFKWDIAPLPVYKEYANDGVTVVNKGYETGHSNVTSLGIWRKSKHKEEAFKVLKYFSMGYAQTISAQAGFYMPTNVETAKTEYINHAKERGLAPQNLDILLDSAVTQRPGDWWYMPDNAWIDVWATPLNLEYRENNKSLDEFFAAYTDKTNQILKDYKNK